MDARFSPRVVAERGVSVLCRAIHVKRERTTRGHDKIISVLLIIHTLAAILHLRPRMENTWIFYLHLSLQETKDIPH